MPAKKTKTTNRRNPERTRNNILACATKAFAKSGYQGTSLSEILAKAKVNKRMVYHYYGSKEGLYRAVHIHQWQILSEWFAQELLPTSGTPEKKTTEENLLLRAVEIFHEFCASHQEFLRLLMWDGLEGGKVSISIWDDIRGPLFRKIEMLIIAGQEQGLLSKDLSPDHFIISFMGAILFYFGYASSLADIFGKDPLSPKMVEERKQQTLMLFRKIVQAP